MPSDCSCCSKPDAAKVCSRCKSAFYCNVDCQRKHWKQHKKVCKSLAAGQKQTNESKPNPVKQQQNKNEHDDDSKAVDSLFRVEEIEGKGMGMRANCDIKAGTMILNEDPLLFMLNEQALDIRSIDVKQFEKRFAKPLLQRFKDLPKQKQETFNALSFKHDGSVLDIFLNNCLTNDVCNFDGVYATLARINHSCNANCLHWIRDQTHAFNARVIARRDIVKDEEITINYLGWQPFLYAERSGKLKDGWRITQCQCSWCDAQHRKKRDALITRYRELDEKIPSIMNMTEKYERCKEMVKMVELSMDANPQLLYRHCWDLAQSALFCRQRDEFVENLVRTVKYKRLAHGKDTEIPSEVEELLQQIPDEDIKKQIYRKIKK